MNTGNSPKAFLRYSARKDNLKTNCTNTHAAASESHPEQAGEPAVLHCIIQIEVIVEVALQ